MNAHLNAQWQARLVSSGWLLAAILISQIAHYFLYALFRRLLSTCGVMFAKD